MRNVLHSEGADAPPAGTQTAGLAAHPVQNLGGALWVCGLTGLAAIPAAFVLIRRTRGPGMES